MQVEERDLECMLAMQQVDLKRLQAEKKLADLPQRKQILSVRQKKAAVLEKQEMIANLQTEARAKVQRVTDEDDQLSQKAATVQAAIDSARGDFRGVESRTKELGGIAKRRATLAADLDNFAEELDKANQLSDQVAEALLQLETAEAGLIVSFQQQGGALQEEIVRCKAEHSRLASTLPESLKALYEKTASKCGGVAVGRLEDGKKCSVCRSVIDESHLVALRTERPLGICPSCRRLIIIQ